MFRAASFAYIDPGSGFPFFSWGPFIIAVLLGFLGGLLFIVKKFFNFFRRYFLIILVILVGSGLIIWRITMSDYLEFNKKIVIIGIDALDFNLMRKFIENNELPNFKRLKEKGSFYPLQTVCPPESNVVWTSFATGMNPGNHGIFDFIMRNPETYLPYLSLTDISSQPQTFKVGPFKFPLLKWKVNKRYGRS